MAYKSKTCLHCRIMFVPTHSRVKFCSRKCINLSRCPISQEIREKVSRGLKKYYETHSPKSSGEAHSKIVGRTTKGKYNPSATSLIELSGRTIGKIMKRLKLGCSYCGWDEASCDIHHIHGRKIEDANNHSNLTYLCPNCHRKAHQHKINPEELISLSVYLGDRWKEVYYG